MSIDEISRKAEEERKKQAKREKKPWYNREDKQGFQSYSPDGWYVYSRIYPYYYNIFLWIFIIMTMGIVFTAMYYFESSGEWSLYTGLVFLVLFAVRVGIHLLLKIYRFSEFKKWRKTLPFQLKGWETLGSFKNFPRGHYWNYYCSLKVNLRSSINQDADKLINDALFVFCTEANKAFYEAGFGMDGRDKWVEDKTEKFKVKGSANAAVVGDMYLCIHKHLRAIHQNYNNIAGVEVEFGNRVTKIEPPSTD
jgi:hypothetical protein